MQQWLGDDWQSQAITWLIAKPLSILFLLLVAVSCAGSCTG